MSHMLKGTVGYFHCMSLQLVVAELLPAGIIEKRYIARLMV